MRKINLCLLVLAVSFAFGSVKTYAQCANPVQWYCPCDELWHAGFQVQSGGNYYPSGQARCCSQIVPNIYGTGTGTCYSATNITKATQNELENLALRNRVFLVACNGDLVPYRDSAFREQAKEPSWSANRALLSYEGKLATRTR